MVCFIDLVRSPPREVRRLSAWGTACTPLLAMTAWRSLAPASLTGSAVSRACAWATLGTYALHRLRERIRLPTFRAFHHQVGGGGLCTPAGSTGRRGAVQTYRPALRAILALGPYGGSRPARVTMRNTEAAVPLSFPPIFPTMRSCATHRSSLSRVLETPPLPATPSRFGNRWHHIRLDHSFSVCS